jgi:GNAT superfamily N-acetyltransferase
MSQTTLELLVPGRSAGGLAGRQPLRIARLRGADYGPVVSMLGRCSPETLQRRFHAITDGVPYVTRLLAGASGEIGYGAWLVGRCMGVASLHVADGSSAEMAVLIEDDWQRRGIGSALVAELARQARQRGLTCLRADVRADNHFVPPALARMGPTRTSISAGVYTIWLNLERPEAHAEGAA